MIRDVIHIKPVKYNAEDDVGYIHITTFNEQTMATADLQKAVDDLKKEIGPKLKGYIIDLRNDPGGLLDQAISVSDAFLDQGAIVITKGRNLEETQRANATSGDITERKKLVMLINGVRPRPRRSWRGRCKTTTGHNCWHSILRQGLRADHHRAWLERCAAADDSTLRCSFRVRSDRQSIQVCPESAADA
jgi:hypothetical protein